MKKIVIFILFVSLALPVFAQSAIMQRSNALNSTMDTAITRTTAKLANFDSQIKDDGDIKVFTSYLRKYESLTMALEESEARLNLYLRTNERSGIIRAERDNYEELLRQLQTIKNEFDAHVRSAR